MSNTTFNRHNILSPQLNFLQLNHHPQYEEEESKVAEIQSISSSDVEDEQEDQKFKSLFPSSCSCNTYESISIENFLNKSSAQDFICAICQNIPNPSQSLEVQCCHHIFCKKCLFSWLALKQTCPLCKSQFSNINNTESIQKLKKANKNKFSSINNLRIKCPDKCKWTGTVLDYKSHCMNCDEKLVNCKYEYLGCTFIDKRKNIRKHEDFNDKYHLDLAKMTIFHIKKEVTGKVRIHPHELKFLDSYEWECDGDAFEGGCRSSQDGKGVKKKGPRFMCPMCKFDLCTECFYYYLEK